MLGILFLGCAQHPPCIGDVSLVEGTNRVSLSIADAVEFTVTVGSTSDGFSRPVRDTLTVQMDGGSGELAWLPFGTSVSLVLLGPRLPLVPFAPRCKVCSD